MSEEAIKAQKFVDQLHRGVHRKHEEHNGHRGAMFSKNMATELLVALNKFARSMPEEQWADLGHKTN